MRVLPSAEAVHQASRQYRPILAITLTIAGHRPAPRMRCSELIVATLTKLRTLPECAGITAREDPDAAACSARCRSFPEETFPVIVAMTRLDGAAIVGYCSLEDAVHAGLALLTAGPMSITGTKRTWRAASAAVLERNRHWPAAG